MKEIKIIAEQIRDELDVAEDYAKAAAKLKDVNSTDAANYADMARQEMAHAETLHKMASRLISKQVDAGVEVPAAMQAVWDWEHERMIDRAGKIRAMLSMS